VIEIVDISLDTKLIRIDRVDVAKDLFVMPNLLDVNGIAIRSKFDRFGSVIT